MKKLRSALLAVAAMASLGLSPISAGAAAPNAPRIGRPVGNVIGG